MKIIENKTFRTNQNGVRVCFALVTRVDHASSTPSSWSCLVQRGQAGSAGRRGKAHLSHNATRTIIYRWGSLCPLCKVYRLIYYLEDTMCISTFIFHSKFFFELFLYELHFTRVFFKVIQLSNFLFIFTGS